MTKIIFSTLALLILAAGCSKTSAPSAQAPLPAPQATSSPSAVTSALTDPIAGGLSRVTKKPFGLYVTPQNSPVQPEKFTGYHTGIDFETMPDEQNIDVAIMAACDGKLLLKKYASGYGGVAVQACKIDGADVTVIYGHLRLSSISPNVGDSLTAGKQFAVLGKGYSTETDGERKHLHFGTHKGTSVNILGYVQKQSDLAGWLNPAQYLH